MTLRVYNVQGQEIATLVEREQAAGRYQVQWHGLNRRGERVAARFVSLQIESGRFQRRKTDDSAEMRLGSTNFPEVREPFLSHFV